MRTCSFVPSCQMGSVASTIFPVFPLYVSTEECELIAFQRIMHPTKRLSSDSFLGNHIVIKKKGLMLPPVLVATPSAGDLSGHRMAAAGGSRRRARERATAPRGPNCRMRASTKEGWAQSRWASAWPSNAAASLQQIESWPQSSDPTVRNIPGLDGK
jgi:hypothetical protein